MKTVSKFSGRSTRSDFWWAFLCNLIISTVISIISDPSDTITKVTENYTALSDYVVSTGTLSQLFSLATFLPNIAIATRRLHDTGKSGLLQIAPYALMFLSSILLIVGIFTMFFGLGIILLILAAAVAIFAIAYWIIIYCRATQPFDNKYGPCPLPNVYNNSYNNQYNNNPYNNNSNNNPYNNQYNNNQYPPNNNYYDPNDPNDPNNRNY